MTNNNLESIDRLVDIAMELVQVHTEASHIEHEVASLKRQLSIEEVPRTYAKGYRCPTTSRSSAA